MNILGTFHPDGSVAYSIPKYIIGNHALSLNDIREACGLKRIYLYEDPMKLEIKLYSHHEAKYLNHRRLSQCPNCGANDWSPSFMLNTDELYELIDYSCAYCGTRISDIYEKEIENVEKKLLRLTGKENQNGRYLLKGTGDLRR